MRKTVFSSAGDFDATSRNPAAPACASSPSTTMPQAAPGTWMRVTNSCIARSMSGNAVASFARRSGSVNRGGGALKEGLSVACGVSADTDVNAATAIIVASIRMFAFMARILPRRHRSGLRSLERHRGAKAPRNRTRRRKVGSHAGTQGTQRNEWVSLRLMRLCVRSYVTSGSPGALKEVRVSAGSASSACVRPWHPVKPESLVSRTTSRRGRKARGGLTASATAVRVQRDTDRAPRDRRRACRDRGARLRCPPTRTAERRASLAGTHPR